MNPAEYWRTTKMRYRLIGTNCSGCKVRHFPGRDVCPDCGTGGNNGRVMKLEDIKAEIAELERREKK